MDVFGAIGGTPLVRIEGIWVKLECANPGGSVKDRIAAYMLREAERRGELVAGNTIVEATSGNTGIALSLVGRSLGYRVRIFMPEHMSVERRRMMEALGADVVLTPEAGGFEEPIRRRDAYRGRPGYYVPDQFANPDNTRCHTLETGRELVKQLRQAGIGRVDAFVAGVGTGGTLMGVGAALRRAMAGVRLVAVEPEESSVLSGGCPGTHGIFGIGDGFVPELLDVAALDEVACVSTEEARAAADDIRSRFGHCVGVSSGANTVAARRLRERGLEVATIWPDCSDRYVSVGLQAPASREVSCPLRAECLERSRQRLPV